MQSLTVADPLAWTAKSVDRPEHWYAASGKADQGGAAAACDRRGG